MRRVLLWLLATIAIGVAASVSLEPAVPRAVDPGAKAALQARALLDQLQTAEASNRPIAIKANKDQLVSAVAIAGRTFGFERLALQHRGDHLSLSASLPLPLKLWLNINARVEASREGFPDVPATVGRLPVPAAVTRFALEAGRRWYQSSDTPLPSLDTLVRRLRLEKASIVVVVDLPDGGGLRQLAEVLGQPIVETDAIAAAYCALAKAQASQPAIEWTTQVRRAFAASSTPQANRAALVALAILAVPKASELAGEAADRVRACTPPPREFLLLGRPDLPKHWALSAGLATLYGPTLSTRIGIWKEVADSGTGGSGFSFVDLAADRSGIVYARAAGNPETAARTAARLAMIEEEQLLPIKALALAEGMSEADFLERFGSARSARFEAARHRMDTTLAKALEL